MSTDVQPLTWERFAQDADNDTEYLFIDQWIQVLEMSGVPKDKRIRVKVTEDENGMYRGWIPSDGDEITMILHEKIFEIQFATGSRSETEAGYGRPVTVRVEKISD